MQASVSTERNGWPLWQLWTVAFLIRLAGVGLDVLFIPEHLVATDTSLAYYPIARNLAQGNGYRVDGDPLAATRIAPLLPLWLSVLMRAAGDDLPLWLPGIFNAAFRAAGVVLLYQMTRSSFGTRAAWWSVWLYLLDPWETLWVGYVLKESLAVPLFLLAVWLLGRLAYRPSAWRAWTAGGAIGLATLARFPSLILGLVAGFIFLLAWRELASKRGTALCRGGLLIGQVVLACGLVLLPWVLFTRQVVGQPVLSSHFAGRYFYTSNGPGVEMNREGYTEPKGIDQAQLEQLEREKPSWEKEGYLFRVAFHHVLTHPRDAWHGVCSKFINTWRPTFENALRREGQVLGMPYSLLNWLILGVPYCLLLAVSLAGVVFAACKRLPCLLLGAPLLFMVGAHLVFWGEIRNRQYMMPLLYAFGGLALAQLAAWFEPRNPVTFSAEGRTE
jgi:4-amino-4-deoxy-L-arabinose transferase-like glycosyltransferase